MRVVTRRALSSTALLGSCACTWALWPSQAPPSVLSSSVVLRRLSSRELFSVALSTHACRFTLAVEGALQRLGFRVPYVLDDIAVRLIREKTRLLNTGHHADNVIVHVVAEDGLGDLKGLVAGRLALDDAGDGSSRVTAVLLDPSAIIGHSLFERYGAALLAGAGVWREYKESLRGMVPAPIPPPETCLEESDLDVLDTAMGTLGALCTLADEHSFRVIIALSSEDSHEGFCRAFGAAHIARCLSLAFGPDVSVLVSVPSADKLSRLLAMLSGTMFSSGELSSLRIHVSPRNEREPVRAYTAICNSTPRVDIVALSGIDHLPPMRASRGKPIMIEHIPGLGDLQSSRLRGTLAGHGIMLVRREVIGYDPRVVRAAVAASARDHGARAALALESRAVWQRVRAVLAD